MKRIFIQQITFMFICLLLPTSSGAYDFKADNEDGMTIYYNVDGNQATVTSGDEKYTGNVKIPATVRYNSSDYSVTVVGKNSFSFCSDLNSIVLPSSVTSIAEYAFTNCRNLVSIDISTNITSIGFNAFKNCSNLEKIKLAEGLRVIGDYAFDGCSKISVLHIPATVTSIGNFAFGQTAALNSIDVAPENTIYDSRQDCNAIIETATNTLVTGCKNSVIPDGIETIGKGAFYFCSGLNSIVLPSSVISIGERAFNNCSNLISVDIPANVTSISSYAFQNCSNLEKLELPERLMTIGNWAFNGCSKLSTVISHIVEPFKMANNVFSENTKSTAVLIVPKGTIEKYRNTEGWNFADIREIDIPEDKTAYALWCEDNATLFFVSSNRPISIGAQFDGHLVNGVWSGNDIISTERSIPAWNERLRDKVSHIVFDSSFKSQTPSSTYAWFAFFNHLTDIQGLENLNMSNATDMQAMFLECSSLATLDLSMLNTQSVTTMKSMFYGCTKLENLNLSGFDTHNVTNMANMFDKCHSLTSINLSCFETGNVEIMRSMFYECKSLKVIDLTNFDTSNVTDMAWMFYGCSSLKSLDLSRFNTGKVSAMRTMFYGCESLENLNLTNWDTSNVESLRSLFMNCKALKELDLSHFITERNTSMTKMFSGCTNLEMVNLTSFDMGNVVECDSVFDHCTNLREIHFGVVNLEKAEGVRHMFCSCNSLQELNLCSFRTENVKYMDAMFNACNELRTIYVGPKWSIKNVSSSKDMFKNCYNLIGANGTTYDSRHIDAAYACVDTVGVPGYLTCKDGVGISEILYNYDMGKESWYSLKGIWLKSKPTRPGLYLHNGHKVRIK